MKRKYYSTHFSTWKKCSFLHYFLGLPFFTPICFTPIFLHQFFVTPIFLHQFVKKIGVKKWKQKLVQTKSWGSGIAGRSTGSMVTNFVLGITFSHKILVKLRRPFGTALLFENVTQEKIPNPSYSRRSPPSSFTNLTLTLILSGGLYILN